MRNIIKILILLGAISVFTSLVIVLYGVNDYKGSELQPQRAVITGYAHPRKARDYLLFTSVGDNSRIREWMTECRKFDVVAVYYGSEVSFEYEDKVDFVFKHAGSKWQNLYWFVHEYRDWFLSYSAVFVLDDDIVFEDGPEMINTLFDIRNRTGTTIISPVHNEVSSKIAFDWLKFQSYYRMQDIRPREIDFVENNMPLFETGFLYTFMTRVYNPVISDWGVDIMYTCACKRMDRCTVGVSDQVVVVNPPLRATGERENDKLGKDEVRRHVWERYAELHGYNWRPLYPTIDNVDIQCPIYDWSNVKLDTEKLVRKAHVTAFDDDANVMSIPYDFLYAEDHELVRSLNIHVVLYSYAGGARLDEYGRVLSAAVAVLNHNADYRFTWVGVSTFVTWFLDQHDVMKQTMQSLVAMHRFMLVAGDEDPMENNMSQYPSDFVKMFHLSQSCYWNVQGDEKHQNAEFDYNCLFTNTMEIELKQFLLETNNMEFIWSRQKADVWVHSDVFSDFTLRNMCTHKATDDVCCPYDFTTTFATTCVSAPIMPECQRHSSWLNERRKTAVFNYRHEQVFVPVGGRMYYSTAEDLQLQFEGYSNIFESYRLDNATKAKASFSSVFDYYQKAVIQPDFVTLTGSLQNTRPRRVAIVVPFRDREKQYEVFMENLAKLDQDAYDFTIIVVKQDDDEPFKRGWLLNIGIVEALSLRDFDCIVTHDVDFLPSGDVPFGTCQMPTILCSELSCYNHGVPYNTYAGGVIGMHKDHWLRLNGYVNSLAGWGGEDDLLYDALQYHHLLDTEGMLRRPPIGKGMCKCNEAGHTKRTAELNLEAHHEFEALRQQLASHEFRDGLTELKFSVTKNETDAYGTRWISAKALDSVDVLIQNVRYYRRCTALVAEQSVPQPRTVIAIKSIAINTEERSVLRQVYSNQAACVLFFVCGDWKDIATDALLHDDIVWIPKCEFDLLMIGAIMQTLEISYRGVVLSSDDELLDLSAMLDITQQAGSFYGVKGSTEYMSRQFSECTLRYNASLPVDAAVFVDKCDAITVELGSAVSVPGFEEMKAAVFESVGLIIVQVRAQRNENIAEFFAKQIQKDVVVVHNRPLQAFEVHKKIPVVVSIQDPVVSVSEAFDILKEVQPSSELFSCFRRVTALAESMFENTDCGILAMNEFSLLHRGVTYYLEDVWGKGLSSPMIHMLRDEYFEEDLARICKKLRYDSSVGLTAPSLKPSSYISEYGQANIRQQTIDDVRFAEFLDGSAAGKGRGHERKVLISDLIMTVGAFSPIVDEADRLVVFPIPGCGSSYQKTVLARTIGLDYDPTRFQRSLDAFSKLPFTSFSRLPLHQVRDRMVSTAWRRVMVVRNPFDRILLFFVDKRKQAKIERYCDTYVSDFPDFVERLMATSVCLDSFRQNHWLAFNAYVDSKWFENLDIVVDIHDMVDTFEMLTGIVVPSMKTLQVTNSQILAHYTVDTWQFVREYYAADFEFLKLFEIEYSMEPPVELRQEREELPRENKVMKTESFVYVDVPQTGLPALTKQLHDLKMMTCALPLASCLTGKHAIYVLREVPVRFANTVRYLITNNPRQNFPASPNECVKTMSNGDNSRFVKGRTNCLLN